VTPGDIQQWFGKTDPGELTFEQLWSLPQSKPGARIILDNQACMNYGVRSLPPWGPFSPPGQTLFSGYYADQCSAAGIDIPDNQVQGISVHVNDAASVRGTEGPGATPIPTGPSKVGGLYNLFIQGTPQLGCLITPQNMFDDQLKVWDELWNQWQYFSPLIKSNLNVVSGDFIDGSWLNVPVINMNAEATPPKPPAITNITIEPSTSDPSTSQATVEFQATDSGTAPITSYLVAAYDGNFTSATGASSPITVTGLTNGQQYQFRMTATNAFGTSPPGVFSKSYPVGASPPTLDDGPAHTGFVGQSYLSSFAVSGMGGARVTLESGRIPPGLTLGQDGTLSGTPTQAGEYTFGVRATNQFGDHRGVATVTISETGAPHPETNWQKMRAKICTKVAKGRRECASRLLFGPFPRLEDRAAVSLVDGPTTYATGHVTRDGTLTLRGRCGLPSERQCEVPFGRYTLAVHSGDHHSTFIPVTLH
jgi:hypothetical protein